MGQPIVHFQIMGKDAIRLQKFYADLFSWKVAEPIPQMLYGLVDGESSGVAGGIGEDPAAPPRVTVFVQVNDLQATLDRAVEIGGKVVRPVDTAGPVALAEFADPDGNVIGLVKG